MPAEFAFLETMADGASEPLDSVDPRLLAVGDLAEQGLWEPAAARVRDLIEEHIYDIRPLSYLFFARFHRDGLKSLPVVLDAAGTAVGARYEAIGPARKRAHNFDKRLTWLFEKILEMIEYHEHKRSPEWTEWHEHLRGGVLKSAITSGEAMARRLAELTSFEESPRALGALIAWMKGHAELLSAPVRKKTEPPPPPPSQVAPLEDEDPETLAVEEQALASLQRRVDLLVSHEFTILVSKLKAFEALVTKADFAKAALVADDLNQVIETFDPRDYFPELFARFSVLFARHVMTITEQLEMRESPQWKAMAQFYRVDPKAFVDG